MTTREDLFTALIAFVCERTGLRAKDVEAVFDADEEFWRHHPAAGFRVLMDEDISEEE